MNVYTLILILILIVIIIRPGMVPFPAFPLPVWVLCRFPSGGTIEAIQGDFYPKFEKQELFKPEKKP